MAPAIVRGVCGDRLDLAGGDALWSRSFGERRQQQVATALAVDVDCRVAVGGWFLGSIDLGGGEFTAEGSPKAFLAIFDIDGHHLWSRAIDGAGSLDALAFGPSGEVVAGGYASGPPAFDGVAVPATGREQGWLASWERDGQLRWARVLGEDSGTVTSLDVDASGRTWFTATFATRLSIDGWEVTSTRPSVAVGRLNSSGMLLWLGAISTTLSWDQVMEPRIGVDGAGIATVVARGAYETLLPDGSSLPAGAPCCGGALFALRLDPSGAVLAAVDFPGGASPASVSLDVSPGGESLLVGTFSDRVNFGFGDLFSPGGDELFVVKLGPGLEQLALRALGGTSSEYTPHGRLASDGGVVISLLSGGPTVELGTGPLPSDGVDVLYAWLEADLATTRWSRSRTAPRQQQALAIVAAPDGTVLLAGSYEAHLDLGAGAMQSTGSLDAFLARIAP